MRYYILAALVVLTASVARAGELERVIESVYPPEEYHAPRATPEAMWVMGQPTLAPDGHYVGGHPVLMPDGRYAGDGSDE